VAQCRNGSNQKRVGVSNRLDGGVNIRLYYLIFMSLKSYAL
jgi:hypothetical protein